jgi:hypothetical protein
MTEFQPKPQTPEQVDEGLRNAFRQAIKDGVMDATPYLKQMNPNREIELLKQEIKMLQSKLSFLDELEKTKSPVEEAYKDWWGQYPELETDSQYDVTRWQGFQAGYEFAYAISTAKEVMEKVQEEQKWDAVRESVKWCEENPDKDPLDCLKPQTPEQVADGLKEAFREAVKQGVVSSTKRQTLYDVIYEWWDDHFTFQKDATIHDLVDRIDKQFIPPSHDTNGYGWEKCLKMMRDNLR